MIREKRSWKRSAHCGAPTSMTNVAMGNLLAMVGGEAEFLPDDALAAPMEPPLVRGV